MNTTTQNTYKIKKKTAQKGMQPCRDSRLRVLGFQGLGLVVAPMPGMHLCQGFKLYSFIGIYTLGWDLVLCQFEHRQANVCRHAYRVPSEPAAGRGTPVPRL